MTIPATPVPLTIEVEDQGTSAIVYCHGRLVYGHTDLLYIPVSHLLPTHKHIILDLCHLTQMDSMGLGSLIRLYAAAKSRGCTIELRNLGAKIRDLLIMTNLLGVFGSIGEQGIRM
jgi:anti-anti-sigma factor